MSPLTRTFLRGCVKHCPVCGQRNLFRRWVTMLPQCPRCELTFERMEGQMSGAVGINTIVTFGVLLIVLVVGTFAFWPEPRITEMIIACAITAVIGPIFFYPFSKTVWLAIDIMMRPVQPGEVLPEFLPDQPYRP